MVDATALEDHLSELYAGSAAGKYWERIRKIRDKTPASKTVQVLYGLYEIHLTRLMLEALKRERIKPEEGDFATYKRHRDKPTEYL